MDIEPDRPSKSISYLRARDPSILAYGHPLKKGRDLYTELLECSSNSNTIISSTVDGSTKTTQEEDDTHLHVYLRMKKSNNYQHLYEISNNTTLVCKVPEGAQCIRNIRDATSVRRIFKFSKIFNPDAQQVDIFNDVVKGKLLHFINGSNCSLLTYGASGSGKTYTIVGTANEPGIIPRALEYLFRTLPELPEEPHIKPEPSGGIIKLSITARKFEKNASHNLLSNSSFNNDRAQHIKTYNAMQQRLSEQPVAEIADDITDVSLSVWVSFAEIYNEWIYDLLTPERPRGQPRRKLRLGQYRGNTYIKDLKCIHVRSGLEAYQILQYGLHNLQYAATSINDHSSRSHSIFTIKLAQSSDTKDGYSVSSFNFCDLAGSERLKKTHNVGDRLKESNNINTSLLVLGRCVSLIRDAQKQNCANVPIPFRESKLTQLFQRALLGQELISMMVNINPIREMFDESQHVLNFSAIAKDVTIEQQPLIQRLPRTNRFSRYIDDRQAAFPTVIEVQDDNVIEELETQVSELMLELEQQKIDAKEEREYIIDTYKGLLKQANEYWEKRCAELERTAKDSRQIALHNLNKQTKEQDASVINLDSSSSSENEDSIRQIKKKNKRRKKNLDSSSSEDESMHNNFVTIQNEVAKLKQQLQERNESIKNLCAEKQSLKKTLDDAVKAYKGLEIQYQNTTKEMKIDILRKEDQISTLQSYYNNFQTYLTPTCDDSSENKENTDISSVPKKKRRVSD